MRKIYINALCQAIMVSLIIGCSVSQKKADTREELQTAGNYKGRAATRGGAYSLVRWENIPPAYSMVSIVSEKDEVRGCRAKNDTRQGKYAQAFLLTNGSMIYEKYDNAPPDEALPPSEQIIKRYSRHPVIVDEEITIKGEDIKRIMYDNGDAYYTLVQSPSLMCYIFFRYSEDSLLNPATYWGTSNYEAVTGSYCGDPAADDSAALQDEMLTFLSNVRFDGGKYTREQILSAAVSGR